MSLKEGLVVKGSKFGTTPLTSSYSGVLFLNETTDALRMRWSFVRIYNVIQYANKHLNRIDGVTYIYTQYYIATYIGSTAYEHEINK